ncbi:MAG: hypothetical protein WAN47_00985 [Nitrosotalea sp.]
MPKIVFLAALCITTTGLFALSENFLISNMVLPDAYGVGSHSRGFASLIGVDIGHCTDSLPCNVHVCADHVCSTEEWEKMNQQITNLQSKKIGNLTSSAAGIMNTVDTFNIGSNTFTSFVQVSYIGNLTANYIDISQLNNDTTIHNAWISSNWNADITQTGVAFHSTNSHISNGKTIDITMVTQGKPIFRLDDISLQN